MTKRCGVWDLESGQTHPHARRPYGLGQGRGGNARRAPRGLGLDDGRCGSGTWRAAKRIRTLEGHTDWVRAVAVTPDGRRAVSGSDDRTLRRLGPGERPNASARSKAIRQLGHAPWR